MNLHQELETLIAGQANIQDGYRLYYDGSVKTVTITESLDTGWCVQAGPIPGAAALIQSCFSEDKYLKVDDLRTAIALRDRIFTFVYESQWKRKRYTDIECGDMESPSRFL